MLTCDSCCCHLVRKGDVKKKRYIFSAKYAECIQFSLTTFHGCVQNSDKLKAKAVGQEYDEYQVNHSMLPKFTTLL